MTALTPHSDSAPDGTASRPQPTAGRKVGRRPGRPGTREFILAAARKVFAAHGFAGSTIRRIAAEAGVDPALVHHYFGNKEKLFLATVQIPVNPRAVVDEITAGPVETLGIRMATVVLGMWESPAGAALAATLRSAITDPAMARIVREFLFSQVISRVLRQIHCAESEASLRGSLLAAQMAGVFVGRHILQLEPLASQSIESLAPNVGATLQHYLTGPLA